MLVSICIPAYNNLKLFKRCLDSVLTQNSKDYEIIVSDDSTNKEIADYIKQLNLKNLVYFHNSPGLGSPENWNNTLSHASGKYIKILHHDDYFTDGNSLRKFVDTLEKNPKSGLAFSYSRIHFKKQDEFFIHKQTRTQVKRLEKEPEFLFFRNVIGAPSATFFRNDKDLLFNTEYKWLVDVEFYIRYLRKYPKFTLISEPLVTVVDGEDDQVSQTASTDKMLVMNENLNLFSILYPAKLNAKKAGFFFQELFVQFEIRSFEQLNSEFKIPANLVSFLNMTFEDLSKGKLVKALKKRLLTSRYNKKLFKIERF